MNPTDLRVTFYFEPLPDQPHAPDGPGFYLAGIRNVGGGDANEVVPRVRMPNDDAIKIAKVLDRLMEGKPLNWTAAFKRDDVSLEQAVLDAIEGGKEMLVKEIAKAEAAAANLGRLRKIQEEFNA